MHSIAVINFLGLFVALNTKKVKKRGESWYDATFQKTKQDYRDHVFEQLDQGRWEEQIEEETREEKKLEQTYKDLKMKGVLQLRERGESLALLKAKGEEEKEEEEEEEDEEE